jgi:hypothetical protein
LIAVNHTKHWSTALARRMKVSRRSGWTHRWSAGHHGAINFVSKIISHITQPGNEAKQSMRRTCMSLPYCTRERSHGVRGIWVHPHSKGWKGSRVHQVTFPPLSSEETEGLDPVAKSGNEPSNDDLYAERRTWRRRCSVWERGAVRGRTVFRLVTVIQKTNEPVLLPRCLLLVKLRSLA